MTKYKTPDEKEIQRINQLQRDFFSDFVHLFDPPLPEGVPERLDRIVASADIVKGDVVLDLGTGTGILVPIIQEYDPEKIFACDLSDAMLARLKEQYAYAQTLLADARDLTLPDGSIDVIFVNACYPNIVDKRATFANISRMMKQGGRMVISHPMGKSFIDLLKDRAPFPLDDFPGKSRAGKLLRPFGFEIGGFVDEPKLYIMKAIRQ
ncbi:MAG: class I SAM-dependent methyltransferase [Deltaproteobacteria bacterium]|nr:class I SAM-dependent methyltransferase [Deltaproteobacteria bacterium]